MPSSNSPAVNGAREDAEEQPLPSRPAAIAVVGLAGRFPGEATNARKLWEMCCQGQSAWSKIPNDRLNPEAFFHPNPTKSGCFNTKGAHFLKEDVGLFDAQFFGITPNEAKAMDPQQRLLLETTYEALENAGIPLNSISGTQTGVYVGASSIDYEHLVLKDTDDIPVYHATGTTSNILANRISYVFNLKGTSITINTACSSGLAALHLACQSLRTGENTQVIVCGSNLMLSPETAIGLSMLRLLGEEGVSYTYDSRGSGYGRGEGIVSLVLKPLDAAIRDSDHIRASIRNTGINQDGKTNGITFPSFEAQAELMRSVYHTVDLNPLDTAYVEAHGTGTPAGDPIEAHAIASVFTEKREVNNPLYVGSLKTNIGHLEASSGLAAFVKTVFALEKGLIPPNINFEEPNKDIPFEEWNLKVPTSLMNWPGTSTRRASLSNFGFGGTNVHVILEEFKAATHDAQDQLHDSYTMNGHPDGKLNNGTLFDPAGAHKPNGDSVNHGESTTPFSTGRPNRRLFVVSANDKTALKTQLSDLASYLAREQDIGDEDMMDRLAFTLSHRRSLLDWREAVSASTISELSSAFTSTDHIPTRPSGKPRLGFVFTGQGSQWFAMGRELFYYPVFAEALQEADCVLAEFGASWSLLDELNKDAKTTLIDRAYISQPATTAIQIALVRLLFSWGVYPSAVVGHSSGEIGAAFAAGALSLKQCMLVAYHRGVVAETLKDRRSGHPGGMLAIGASPVKIRPMIKRLGSAHVVMACVNGPSLVTASGDVAAIAELQTQVEEDGIFNRRLKVDVAYHSPHMRDITVDYLAAIKDVAPIKSSGVQFHSTVEGRQIHTEELTAAYWVKNMISPVEFVDGFQSMYSKGEGPDTLVEIGPHSALEAPIKDIFKSSEMTSNIRYFSALVRKCDASLTALSLAAALHTLGCSLDFSAINDPHASSSRKILDDLPSYPWNHSKRHWHESRLSVNHRSKRFPRSDLLGSLVNDFNENEPRWRNILRLADLPWLYDHKIQGSFVFPAASYIAMAVEASFQYGILHQTSITSATQCKLREVQINRPMLLSEDISSEVSLIMRPWGEASDISKSWIEFLVFSWTSKTGWIEHCRGLVSLRQSDTEPNVINGKRQLTVQQDQYNNTRASLRSKCQTAVDLADIYSKWFDTGLEYGPAFRNLTAGQAYADCAICSVSIPDTSSLMPNVVESRMLIHPATFDAFLQATDVVTGRDASSFYVPRFFKEVTVSHGLPTTPGDELQVFSTREKPSCDLESNTNSSFIVTDAKEESRVLIQVHGYEAFKMANQDTEPAWTGDRGLCYQMQLEPCLDLMTREQYSDSLTKLSGSKTAGRQCEILEKAAFYHLEMALDSLSKEHVNVPNTHLQSLHRVLSSLMVQVQQGEWPFQASDWLSCNNEERRQFLSDLAASDECGRLVCSMGESLVPIFKGEVDPLSVMVRDDMLEAYYRCNGMSKLLSDTCAEMVLKLAHQNPNMKIIEIGAGTGSTTMPVLQALGLKFAHYDFTDISSGFFERARTEQKEWSGKISYRRLNVEQDPVGQGFQPESYDLVIAANVLHATVNMDTTVHNVRKLLKSGGKALIGELTVQLLAHGITFATLPGWWLGEEDERRDGPLLTETAWDKVCRRCGFSGLDGSVQIHDGGPKVGSVMLTKAIAQGKPSYPAVSLIIHDDPLTNLLETIRPSLHKLTGLPVPVRNLLEVDLSDKYGIVLAMGGSVLSELDEAGFRHMQTLFSTTRGILWVTRGASSQSPEASMVTGLIRSLRTEKAGFRFVTLDLDGKNRMPDDQVSSTILRLFEQTFGSNSPGSLADTEFLEVNGVVQIPRIVGNTRKDEYVVRETHSPVPEPQPFVQQGRSLELKVGQVGQLDSIFFEDDLSFKDEIKSDEVEICVKSTGMNFLDVMISLGQVPFFHKIGIECSGIVTAVGSNVKHMYPGSRVCAMAKGAYANFVRVPQHRVAKIPDSLGFTEAASLPVVFCTAHYALSDIGRLSEGESILIHAAAGGVGQAAILLAQEAKAEIFVTVGSQDKKDLIMQTYSIAESHIFSSRDTSFQQELMIMTNQKGVDVVLNSTAGEILRQSWQCLARLGRFIEIGKRDLVQNSNLEMGKFLDSVSFSGFDLGVLADAKPYVFQRLLTDVIKMYENNTIRLISPVTVYPISQLQHAMRQMQSGKHSGKIVIEAGSEHIVQALPQRSSKIFTDAASYLITGGTGGIGRSITRWLARAGAKHIILISRSGTGQKGVSELLEELRNQNVNVIAAKCDISDLTQIEKVLMECQKSMPPIKGVIHGAMALRDSLFEKMSFTDWQLNIKPRVQGAWNLHNALADANLDFFLMLGSIAAHTGTIGQSAYAATNTFFDTFASYRRDLGLAGSVIDIGKVVNVGYVAENSEREAQVNFTIHDALVEAELLALIKAHITGAFSGNNDQQTITGLKLSPDKPLPTWASDPRFPNVLAGVQSDMSARSGDDGRVIAVRDLLKQADSPERALEVVTHALFQKLSRVLIIAVEDVDPKKPVVAYGLDSLIAVELRNWITVELDANVPLMELMNSPSIEALAAKIAARSKSVDRSTFPEGKD